MCSYLPVKFLQQLKVNEIIHLIVFKSISSKLSRKFLSEFGKSTKISADNSSQISKGKILIAIPGDVLESK